MKKPLTVLYFAWVRETIGLATEEVALPDGVETVADLVEALASRSPAHTAAFRNRAAIRCAVNQEFAERSSRIADGDEVAFFPPVTGG